MQREHHVTNRILFVAAPTNARSNLRARVPVEGSGEAPRRTPSGRASGTMAR